MDGIEIRATAPDEYRAASATVSMALMRAPANDDDWNKPYVLPSWTEHDSLSAWDGDRCVGHASGFRFDTLAPGGAWLPTSGVTRVGVLSTHRRRGLLRAMMTRLLTEAAERGQVLASLRASETRIYLRYGFGLAGRAVEAALTTRHTVPITGAAQGGTMRILRHDEVLSTLPAIYERVANRPGTIRRPEWMWQRYLEKAAELGGDADLVAVHRSPDGVDDGFVNYLVKWKEERFTAPRGTGEVLELFGADPGVELALWEYVCGVDLVDEWYCGERPVDDVLKLAVADPRAYRTGAIYDEQWLRVLDVDAALTARAYAESLAGDVTIGVTDALLTANTGSWNVSPSGAKRLGTDADEADLVVDVGALAAAYLGDTRFSALAAAGRVDVRNPATLAAADALFAVDEAPFCGSGF